MKIALKTLALSLIMVVSSISSYANDLSLGFHIGPNFSTASYDDNGTSVNNINTSTRLAVGFLLNAPLSPLFSLQPELNYVGRGFDRKFDSGVTQTYDLDYFEIPVLLKADILGHTAPIRPSVYVGPMLSFLTGKSLSESDSDNSVTVSGEAVDIFNSTVFSAVFGAGVDFTVHQKISLGLDLRYNLGLTNAIDQSKDEIVKNDTMKNRGFQLMAAVLYRL